jgi:hypothetical protein
VSHDLTQPYKDTEDVLTADKFTEPKYSLVLRAWVDINPGTSANEVNHGFALHELSAEINPKRPYYFTHIFRVKNGRLCDKSEDGLLST